MSEVTRVTEAPPAMNALLECQCGSRYFIELHPVYLGEANPEEAPGGVPTCQCPGCGAIWQLRERGWARSVVGRNLLALRQISVEVGK